MDQLFERSSIKKAYFTLAMPVVLSSAVIIIYNLVDTFFVSKTQNPDLVAGVSQGAPVFSLLMHSGKALRLGKFIREVARRVPHHKEKLMTIAER